MKTRGLPEGPIAAQVAWVLAWLEGHASKATRDGMARYAIPSEHAFGVSMRDLKALGKLIGRNHPLALALWRTGRYEARMVTAFVADPARLTPAEMDRWCKDFDNWAYCDTLAFLLFDRSPHAWARVAAWSKKRGEFEKRAAFALLWSLALHDKAAPDARFHEGLALIEAAAADDRNFVKKAVDMALRAVGRRNRALAVAAAAVATRLEAAAAPSAQWIGRSALRAFAPAKRRA